MPTIREKAYMKCSFLTPAVLALALFAGACGKDNESGKKKVDGGTFFGSLGSLGAGAVPGTITNPHIQKVFQSTACTTGGGRVGISFALNMSVAANANYVGITSEGDIAVVTNTNGQSVFNAFICQRPSLGQGQGSMSTNPALNRSVYCQVDEITAARMQLPGAPGYPPYILNFRAVHFGGPGTLNQVLPTFCRSY